MIPLLTIWPHREIPGWDGDEASLSNLQPLRSAVPLLEALADTYRTDAHVWPGVVRFDGEAAPEIPRINLPSLNAIRAKGGDVLFGSIWVDVDDGVAHDAKIPARPVWRAMLAERIAALPVELRDGLGHYDTRGGARLFWALDREVPPEVFVTIGKALRERLRALGFDRLDELKDWGRCYRAPNVIRDGEAQRRPCDLSGFGDVPLLVDQLQAARGASTASPLGAIGSARTPFQLPPVIPAGQRNQTLTRLAGSLRRAGLEERAILAALREEVDGGRCGDWVPDRGELEQIARSVGRYEPGPLDVAPAPAPPPPFRATVTVQPPAPPGEEAPPPVTIPLDRPTIRVRAGELVRIVGEIEDALIPANIHQRGGRIVAVGRDPSAGSKLRIRPLEKQALRLAAAYVADWQSWKASRGGGSKGAGILGASDGPEGDWVPTDPPMHVIEALAAKGEWRFPPLVGVSEIPIVRHDGSIWTTPGYDAETGYLYDPGALEVPPIPERPTKAEARAALDELAELVAEFPFQTRTDRSVALASFLTCVSRSAMSRAPLTIVDGHTPSSGKSLIAQVGAILATGDEIPVLSETADEELEKRITSMLRCGDAVILIDNVTRPVGGSSLDALLTASHWKGRVLGASEMVELPNVATWYVSGNNVGVRGDLTRRALRCFLDSPVERPELRADFRIMDLPGHVKRNRGRLVAAALTVIRARAQEREAQRLPALGSFREWSFLVRDALVWLDEADPVASQESLRAVADLGLAAFSELLGAWRSYFTDSPIQITEALELLDRKAHEQTARRVIRAIEELTELPLNDRKTASRLGYAIRSRQGRTVDGLAFFQRGEARTGRRWIVERVAPGAVRR